MTKDNIQPFERLRNVFNHEIANNNLKDNVVKFMYYITQDEAHFNAFHDVCAFLMCMYTKDFMEEMGYNTETLDINKIHELPWNEMN